jgi:hypothetical protein
VLTSIDRWILGLDHTHSPPFVAVCTRCDQFATKIDALASTSGASVENRNLTELP